MTSTTEREISSRVYLRYFDFTKYYETEKKLPAILDSEENGGKLYAMNQTEWDEFSDKIDACFSLMNRMLSFVFFGKLAIVVTVFMYVFVVYIAFIWGIRLSFLYILLGLFGGISLFNCYVQTSVNKTAIERAKAVCQEQTVNLNLKAGEESAIRMELHYEPWKPCSWRSCEAYEVDSNDRTRNAKTFLEISRGSSNRSEAASPSTDRSNTGTQELPSVDSFYRKNGPGYQAASSNVTAPSSDEFADIENQEIIPTAVHLEDVRLESSPNESTKMEPYVTVPLAKAELQPSKDKPMAKAKPQPSNQQPKSEVGDKEKCVPYV